MTSGRFSRRSMLRLGAAAAGASFGGLAMPYIATAQRQVRVRRDIHELEAEDPNHPIIAAYRRGVQAMKALDQSDPNNPLGWTRQATIHQERCPHGHWFFLPWHRAYLIAFEDIVRAVSRDDTFALPYWNWVKNPTMPRSFLTGVLADDTRQFGSGDTFIGQAAPDGAPLGDNFVADLFQRNVMDMPEFMTFGGEIRGQTANRNIDWQKAGEDGWRGPPNFNTGEQLISGPVENGPHNAAHSIIGGNMGGFMSPLDPIFWLHHCNVDRLWTVWRECGRAAGRPTTPQGDGADLWLNYSFNFGGRADFVTPERQPRVFKVSDLQSVTRNFYSYGAAGNCGAGANGGSFAVAAAPGASTGQGRAAAPAAARPAAAVAAPLPPLDSDWRTRGQTVAVSGAARSAAPARAAVPAAPAAGPAAAQGRGAAPRGAAPSGAFSLPASGTVPSRVVAEILGISVPQDASTTLRIFVNNPGATSKTPTSDPSYVTTISFFGHGRAAAPAGRAAAPAQGGGHAGHAGHGGDGGHKVSQVVDLTRALNALRAAGRLQPGQTEIQLVAVGGSKSQAGADPTVQVSKVRISGNRT